MKQRNEPARIEQKNLDSSSIAESGNPPSLSIKLMETAMYAAKSSVPLGLAGVLYGVTSSTYRGTSIGAHATAMGLNYLFLSFGIFALERGICQVADMKSNHLTFAFGGIGTGACIAAFQGGLKSIPKRSGFCGILGIGFFEGLEAWEKLKDYWRQERYRKSILGKHSL